ncbi:MAG: two-component system, OmpR family, sensor kinase [Frankiaceae bacterium]|nr:two-component system, OmpR family, sensor kinase [Frankiaceae bacterium]
MTAVSSSDLGRLRRVRLVVGSRLRLRGRSLRFQIVALVLTLLVVSSIVVAAGTALALHGFLIKRLDQQLAAAGDRFAASLEVPDDHDLDNTAAIGTIQGQAEGTLGARVRNGKVTAAELVPHEADDAKHASLAAKDFAVLGALKVAAGPRTIKLPHFGDYRIMVMAGDDNDLLITGLPEHPVDETIAQLLLIEASVFTVALLITGSIGAVSVRLSLRPLARVSATARAVSALPLSTGTISLPERVAVAAPKTEAGQVTDAFNHMLEHVESALHDRHASEDRLRHFIADASHELRTPVAVIRSHSEYAQRVGGTGIPAPVTEALSRITAESDRMGHLVDDLLLLARLDSGRELEQIDVDLTRTVLDAVSDARVTGTDHQWRLQLPEDEVHVVGDQRALHQVLANLLANARAHTPSGTTILTSLRAAESRQVVLTVSDDGPGIPDDVLPRIFDRFVRAGNISSGAEGSGLGLAIVAAIISAHDGTIQAESRPGDTTFTITLPQAKSVPMVGDGQSGLECPPKSLW